jgi:hypothetical protein
LESRFQACACLSFSTGAPSILRERKGMKTHTLALIEGPKGGDSGPEAFGSLEYQHQDLSFRLGHELASGLRANPLQESTRVFHPRHVHRGFVSSLPGGTTLSTWAVEEVLPMGATLSGRDTSPGGPWEVRLEAASIEAAGTGAVLVPLAVGLSVPLGFFGAAGWSSKCPPAVVPTVTSFSPLGDLDTGGSSAGRLLVPPAVTLLRGLFFFVGCGAEISTLAVAPLTGRPAYTAPTSV